MIMWNLFLKKWVRVLTHPLFSVLTVTALGLSFTILFALVNLHVATIVSVLLFLLTIMVSVVVALFAKTEVNLVTLAQQKADQKKYPKALAILDSAISTTAGEEETCELHMVKAQILCRAGRTDEAISSYQLSVGKEKYACLWKAHYELAMLYRGKYGRYSKEVLASLIEAINIRTLFKIKADDADINLCRLITDIYEHNHNRDDANKWFLKEMAIRENLLNINTSAQVQSLCEQGENARSHGENMDAVMQYKKAIEILEPILTEEHLRVAEINLILGDIYWKNFDKKYLQLALTYFQRTLHIRQKYLGSPLSASIDFLKKSQDSLLDFSKVYILQGEEYFNLAMSEFRGAGLGDSVGEIIKNRDKAIDIYKAVLHIHTELFGADSLLVADVLIRIGNCYKWIPYDLVSGTKIAESRKNLMKAADIWEKNGFMSTHQLHMYRLFDTIGGTYYMEGNFEKSLQWRLDGSKILLSGDHSMEEAAIAEFGLREVYEKTAQSSTKTFEEFLQDNKIEGFGLIEKVVSKKEIGVKFSETVLKLKGVDEPIVLQGG